MEPLQQRKEALLNYILQSFDQYDFRNDDNTNQLTYTFGFLSYNQFVAHQSAVIDSFNEGSIGTMEFLRNQIIPISETMNDEYTESKNIRGFFFNANNKIIFVPIRI